LRQQLLASSEYDGYLLYSDGKAVGWCQVGRRDRLPKLAGQFALIPDEAVWAITCFQTDPELRQQGLAGKLLAGVLDDLRQRGVQSVQAYPKIDAALPAHNQWTGPKTLYAQAGFHLVRDNKTRAIFQLELDEGTREN
jgi:GNAT superfamily N-acetyltransferase